MRGAVRVSIRGSVTTVTLDRPRTLNALDRDMHLLLERAFDSFAADEGQRVCVVTGAGKAFCAGSDLRSAHSAGIPKETYPPHGYAGLVERHDLEKPVIAAVNGAALGGGFELALACDIVLADAAAVFALPEPRVGAVALGGGIHRLARQIGQKQAMGMLLSSRRFSAEDGLRMGFVNAVAAPGALDKLVEEWVADVLAGAPLAIMATKAGLIRGLERPELAEALARQGEEPSWRRWEESDEAKLGVTAFVDKRSPPWIDCAPAAISDPLESASIPPTPIHTIASEEGKPC